MYHIIHAGLTRAKLEQLLNNRLKAPLATGAL